MLGGNNGVRIEVLMVFFFFDFVSRLFICFVFVKETGKKRYIQLVC